MNRLAFLALALCASALAGCWESDEPLMPKEEMDWPKLQETYLTQTPATSEFEAVVSIARHADHYELSETLLDDKNWTSRYYLNFDELKPGWYLIQMSPVALPKASQADASRTYYKLLRTDGRNWQEFDFSPGCPNVPERLRSNLEQLDMGCVFKDYSILRSQALLASERVFFNPSTDVLPAGVSSADYERALIVHFGPIPWSKRVNPNPMDIYGLGKDMKFLLIVMTVLTSIPLLAGIWIFIKWRWARVR